LCREADSEFLTTDTFLSDRANSDHRDWRFFMTLEKNSGCKVNLLLNILGKRPDGFHELETVIHPVNLFDTLTFARAPAGVSLTCSNANLAVDESNLVHRAASAFINAAQISDGVKIHLEKRIPMAAGLGGGSGNAATTLLALNELFGNPLSKEKLFEMAASLGSDIPFFLQSKPALATGRGENIEPLEFFGCLRGRAFLLIHPGFGISTPWAYQQLARFREALNGKPGRARTLIKLLQSGDLAEATREFYNALEAPALYKFPLLEILQEFARANGALVVLMSGSGSTTFALLEGIRAARDLDEKVREKFGKLWTAVAEI
jgi:4-diphosphocytidyl-2-C-methyl-D-erythritol kinase